MDFDDTVLRRQASLTEAWLAQFRQSSDGICELAGRYRGSNECFLKSWHCGSFNLSVRLHWEDGGPDWLIRFPIPGKSMLPEEKVRNEVCVMKFIQQNTNIPVPSIIASGMGADNPAGLGPFIIMVFVEGRKMSDILKAKSKAEDDETLLDLAIDDSILKSLYAQLADIHLELFEHDFDRIGSLSLDAQNNSCSVRYRPMTLNMNEIMRCSGLPGDCFPSRPYASSADYLLELSEVQFTHLLRQRNSVFDAADCREKYTCRHLFQAIIPRFICRTENAGPFKLTCDDLCPGNILVNDSLQIVAALDWEFCYAAPIQFSSSPPWWLLLKKPGDWLADEGPESFLNQYTPKLELFLQTMEQREEARTTVARVPPSKRLSARMRQAFDDKSFWFNMAARTSFEVDDIYWYMLDEYCYGPRASIRQRVISCTSGVPIHNDRERIVRLKLKQLQDYNVEVGREDQVSYEDENGPEETIILASDIRSVEAHPTIRTYYYPRVSKSLTLYSVDFEALRQDETKGPDIFFHYCGWHYQHHDNDNHRDLLQEKNALSTLLS